MNRSARTGLGLLLVVLTSFLSLDAAWATSSDALVEVNGEIISSEDIDRSLGVKLIQLEQQLYNLKRNELDSQVEQRLLAQAAARRALSVAALLDVEVTSKVALVTEAETDEAYQANKSRFVGSESMIRDRLRGLLQEQKLAAQRKAFVNTLRSEATIVDHSQPPRSLRLSVSSEGAPAQGAIDAPVTIVEFSDFHCPFCRRAEDTLRAVMNKYVGKVRLVYRQFPIQGLHPQAVRASEASLCAKDQGKFWEYHAMLFNQAPRATDDDLERYAEELGLDANMFSSCLFRSQQHRAVQQDIEEGTKLGITGTPAFFINGRFLNGAQPLEKFVQIIEEELARLPVEVSEARH